MLAFGVVVSAFEFKVETTVACCCSKHRRPWKTEASGAASDQSIAIEFVEPMEDVRFFVLLNDPIDRIRLLVRMENDLVRTDVATWRANSCFSAFESNRSADFIGLRCTIPLGFHDLPSTLNE